MITQEQIQKLARLRDPEYPVTSLFLNLNGGRDSRKSSILLKDLLKRRRGSLEHLSRHQSRSVEQDFSQIERYVQGFARKGTRALAIFASSGAEIWEVFPLARRVQDRLVVDTHPHIRPLSRLLHECKRCGVVLLARDRARLDLVHLGEIEPLEVMSGEVLPLSREHGFQGSLERRQERRSDDQHQRFIKEVASRTLEHHRRYDFDYVLLGGSREAVAAYESVAHRYITERVIARLAAGPDTPGAELLEIVSTTLLEHEERRSRELMARILREADVGGLGVVGVESTLRAMVRGQVASLMVLKGVSRPGSGCPHCSYLGVRGGACPQCGADLLALPDVIEEAVDRSLAQSADVHFVGEHAELEASGGLAALLRYR
ncbi:MAG: hypothetical protein PVF43_15225 [Candidatus Eiseniibacteriota bacterium]